MMSISIGRLTTICFSSSVFGFFFFVVSKWSFSSSSESSVCRAEWCDKRHLLNPPSFLEHHKTLNSTKDIQMCLRISPIYLPSPLSPPRAHKRHRSTIVTFFAISFHHHHGSRRRQPRAQDLASVFRFGCIHTNTTINFFGFRRWGGSIDALERATDRVRAAQKHRQLGAFSRVCFLSLLAF